MTFTSYAQNFEDVMLWRALKHVTNGKYVDVGAQHPIVDSVSKAFYEQGWRGIHIEPVRQYADLLRQDRPDETVLEIALSDQAGLLELNVIADTGLSTGVKEYAESHMLTRGFDHTTVQVPMLPLRLALASLAGQQVHWLKIDVEGLEEEVLKGWNSQELRPWIVVVEATVPLSTEPHYSGAHRILEDADYRFTYFDGLNRFYIASEHAELASAFAAPPNVFDEAELSGLSSASWSRGIDIRARSEREDLERRLGETQSRAASLEESASAQIRDLEENIREAQARQEEAKRKFEQQQTQVAGQDAQIAALTARVVECDRRASAADDRATSAELRLAQTAAVLSESLARAEASSHHVNALLRSTSWRVTAPFRFVVSTLRGQLSQSSVDKLARVSRRLGLFKPARFLYRVIRGSRIAPPQAVVHEPRAVSGAVPVERFAPNEPRGLVDLSEDARMIYCQLKSIPRTTLGSR